MSNYKLRAHIYRLKIPILLLALFITYASYFMILVPSAFAQAVPPSSNNFKLMDYGFGAGGTATSSSSNYSLFGTVGQVDQGSPSSANYFIGAGLEYTLQASTPAMPTFTNPNNWYNKLKIVINRGGNDPNDTTYAIRIASGSGQFQYVQNDNTVGNVLGLEDWQSYSAWGGASGTTLIGLYPGTTYTVQVAAKQGQFFTQFMWSPATNAATSNPTLSFDIDVAPTDTPTSPPYAVAIGNLNPGTVTTAANKIWVSFGTNSNNGGLISINDSNSGLQSSTATYTISSGTVDLTAQPTGYGAQSNSVSQTTGGPMQPLSPYNGSIITNNIGALSTAKQYIYDSSQAPVTGGRVSFMLKAKASNTTPSALDYTDTLTVIATGSF